MTKEAPEPTVLGGNAASGTFSAPAEAWGSAVEEVEDEEIIDSTEEQDDEEMECYSCSPDLNAIPPEITAYVMTFLDGESLLAASGVCRAWEALSRQREFWKHICAKKWPLLGCGTLPQLPGAPDYDLIRLYHGDWKKCFVDRNKLNARAELIVEINNFSQLSGERIESEKFCLGEHHFCLWIYPRGNPHERDYAGRVLSMYLVMTDLEEREENWVTCAVFTLFVKNQLDSAKSLEWHSSLNDMRFDEHLTNWGVHSLAPLEGLMDPARGFRLNDKLVVGVQLRLMSITFSYVTEKDFFEYSGLGLADMQSARSFELPFCCNFKDLVTKVTEILICAPEDIRIWCFNQPITSGYALRPRRLLSHHSTAQFLPMFGGLLRDGIDIDAYSTCLLYIENLRADSLTVQDEMLLSGSEQRQTGTKQRQQSTSSAKSIKRSSASHLHHSQIQTHPLQHNQAHQPLSTFTDISAFNLPQSLTSLAPAGLSLPPSAPPVVLSRMPTRRSHTQTRTPPAPLAPTANQDPARHRWEASTSLSSTVSSSLSNLSTSTQRALLFLKFLDPKTGRLQYMGRAAYSESLQVGLLCQYIAKKFAIQPQALEMHKEEMIPRPPSGPHTTYNESTTVSQLGIQEADILIFSVPSAKTYAVVDVYQNLWVSLYLEAYRLRHKAIGSVTLHQVETLSERLGIQKFRVRSAFRKCNEDSRATLAYIMEGRHLGFICDNCGETDFRGVRYNCEVCEDYDLCEKCQATAIKITHRYANIHGKWQKQLNFADHEMSHIVNKILPVFHNFRIKSALHRPAPVHPHRIDFPGHKLPRTSGSQFPSPPSPSFRILPSRSASSPATFYAMTD